MRRAAATALAIDVGGTRCRAAVIDAAGRCVRFAACPTPLDDLRRFLDVLRGLAASLGAARPITCPTAGIGLPGIVDERTGMVRTAVNLPFLNGVCAAEVLAEALGRRVLLETDVNAAAWAQWHAAAPRAARFVHLCVGTGVGAAAILDGRLERHTHGGAGHWGHVLVDPSDDAPQCACGARGCLEAFVRRHREARATRPAKRAGVRAVRTSRAARTPRAARGRGADVPARGMSLVEALAAGCLQIAAVYAPQVIALGGGVVDAAPRLAAQVAALVGRRGGSVTPPDLRIERAALPSDRAGVTGAGLLALACG